jgi:hypothetical protein
VVCLMVILMCFRDNFLVGGGEVTPLYVQFEHLNFISSQQRKIMSR